MFKNREVRAVLGALVGGAILAGVFGIVGLIHSNHLNDESSIIATQLGNQGITHLGHVDAAAMVVPLQATPKCAVAFNIKKVGSGYELYLDYNDANGHLISPTDTISDSKTAVAVQVSLATMVKDRVCK